MVRKCKVYLNKWSQGCPPPPPPGIWPKKLPGDLSIFGHLPFSCPGEEVTLGIDWYIRDSNTVSHKELETDTSIAMVYSLGHSRKHICLRSLSLCRDPVFQKTFAIDTRTAAKYRDMVAILCLWLLYIHKIHVGESGQVHIYSKVWFTYYTCTWPDSPT